MPSTLPGENEHSTNKSSKTSKWEICTSNFLARIEQESGSKKLWSAKDRKHTNLKHHGTDPYQGRIKIPWQLGRHTSMSAAHDLLLYVVLHSTVSPTLHRDAVTTRIYTCAILGQVTKHCRSAVHCHISSTCIVTTVPQHMAMTMWLRRKSQTQLVSFKAQIRVRRGNGRVKRQHDDRHQQNEPGDMCNNS